MISMSKCFASGGEIREWKRALDLNRNGCLMISTIDFDIFPTGQWESGYTLMFRAQYGNRGKGAGNMTMLPKSLLSNSSNMAAR